MAGIITILPIGGLVLVMAYIENSISHSGIFRLPFYFPGLGILLVVVATYLIGLTTSTVVGNWAWRLFDRSLNSLPALGKMYASLKQILGYGEGENAMFHQTVLVPSRDGACDELGLVTNEITLDDGSTRLVVFVPGTPNAATGRLVITTRDQIKMTPMSAHEALKALVAVGKTDIRLE
jgi:uncharacterized membrane protein